MEQWYIKNRNVKKNIQGMDLLKKTKLRILLNRNITEFDEMKTYFLNPLTKLGDASQFNDFEILLERINQAKKKGETVAIVGDYDVDGIMSTAILLKTFHAIGVKSTYVIPNRMIDGYGINTDIIDYVESQNINFIITVDNGIQAFKPLEYAMKKGIDVFVTDHHQCKLDDLGKDVLPKALGVINPHRQDSKYPYPHLCGAGIAYIISKKLLKLNSISDFALENDLIAFAGMATICDVVELKKENRIIAYHGILAIRNTSNIGLLELLKVTEIQQESVDSYHIGFIIGPRLNAGGRLEIADLGVELLTTECRSKAEEIADKLNSLNEKRKNLTEIGYNKAMEMINKEHIPNFIVLHIPEIHESVAGIIAGRIKEYFYRPTIILTDSEKGLKGSGRSVEEYDIYSAVSKFVHLTEAFGGHKMACGLTIKEENLKTLALSLDEDASAYQDEFVKKIYVDAFFPLELVDMRFLDMINSFKPFGKSNEEPLFSDLNLKLMNINIYGKNRNVIKLKFLTKTNVIKEVVLFESENDFFQKANVRSINEFYSKIRDGIFMDIVFYPKLNEYNGNKNVDIVIKAYRYRKGA